ncbi:MAG: B12-binding domain-containing radical SAM protein [Firmicutes bacterium]|nr:B12-binding domain-containing radical SAM protein [Bacillota bacterium]
MILLTTLNSQYVHTALALYTLQAYCRPDFPDLQVLEFNINQSLDWILGEIYRKKPRILGISTNIWNITQSLELVDRVKKVRPETVVILGGPEATADYAAILKRPGAPDYIVLGEGEATLRELLVKLEGGQPDLSSIAGLAWCQGGEPERTPDRAPIDLATLPFPYPDLTAFRHRILYYEASRGCPFRCTYCLSGWEKAKLRTLPLDRVKADLKRFVTAGVRTVKLIDRTFNVDRARAAAVLQFLLEQGEETEFHFELVGELLDEELIRLLKAAPAGRFRVEIGVQSTCVEALKAVRRYQDLAKLQANCLALPTREEGLDQPRPLVHLDLIAGLPYEDLATFGRSFDWTFRLRPDELQLGFLKLLKGSPLREQAAEYGYAYTKTPPYELLRNKWLSYADLLVLKGVEEMVEKFFNSRHFRYTLAYLFRDETLSPWAFFAALARFGRAQGFSGQARKQTALYHGLWQFLTSEFLPKAG